MNALKNYLLQVTATGLLVSITLALLPNGRGKKVAQFCGNLLIVLAVLSPLVTIKSVDFARGFVTSVLEGSGEHPDFSEQGEIWLSERIKNQCEAYVLDKAAGHGMAVDIEIRLEERDEQYPYPKSAIICGKWNEEERQYLQNILEENMGIPPERQEWIVP